MSSSPPSWRVKTRPCPFYQQGRCYFADDCNFQHSISARTLPSSDTQVSSADHFSPPPRVNVTSPTFVRSPPRSPRLAGLLLALKDVIGEDSEDECENTPATDCQSPDLTATSSQDYHHHSRSPVATVNCGSEPPPPSSPPIATDTRKIGSSPARTPSFNLLSPVESSHLNLLSFSQDFNYSSASSINSGSVETSESRTQLSSSPPRSPLQSTFGLLSSPFRPPSSRVLSPHLGVFINRQPQTPVSSDIHADLSLDSPGKGSAWGEDDIEQGSEEYVVVDDIHSSSLPYIDPPLPQDDSQQHVLESQSPPVASSLDHVVTASSPRSFLPQSSLTHPDSVKSDHGFSPAAIQEHPVLGDVSLEHYMSSNDSDNDEPVTNIASNRRSQVSEALEASSPRGDSLAFGLSGSEEPRLSVIQEAVNVNHSLDLAADPADNQTRASSPSDALYNLSDESQLSLHPDSARQDNRQTEDLEDAVLHNYYSSSEQVSPVFTDDDLSERLVNMGTPDESFRPGSPISPLSGIVIDQEDFDRTTQIVHSPVEEFPVVSPIFGHDSGISIPQLSGTEDDGQSTPPDPSLEESDSVDPSFSQVSPFVDSPVAIGCSSRGPVTHECSSRQGTAELAYLQSPTDPHEHDTLSSIYADYSGESGGSTESSESLNTVPDEPPKEDIKGKQPLSASISLASGLRRERVFEPPPASGRITPNAVAAASLDSSASASLPSPPISFNDMFRDYVSASSVRSASSPGSSVSRVLEAAEAAGSKKVPFGFRQSAAPGPSGRSLLGSDSAVKASKAIKRISNLSSQSDRAFSPDAPSPAESSRQGLRPLRLSALLHSQPLSAPSHIPAFRINSYRNRSSCRASVSFATVSSRNSQFNNSLLSSKRTSTIPEHVENTLDTSSPLSSVHLSHLANFDEPHSAPLFRPAIWQNTIPENLSSSASEGRERPPSRSSEPRVREEDGYREDTPYDHDGQRATPIVPRPAAVSHVSVARPPMYAIATPCPTLMFAIASDDVKQVRDVLERGDASPNDCLGPQSALEFALTNDQLLHRVEIVKMLLAFGANPKVVTAPTPTPTPTPPAQAQRSGEGVSGERVSSQSLLDTLDPATKYYVERADAPHTRRTSALVHRSFFRPLTRVRYELVGQDRALEELFKVLSIRSRQLSVTPIVVLLCGPSGHGKSLLARKFGALLDVPTHTVNMTTLNSTQDLWRSYSMSPYETPTTCTLAEFLINNEGKRCIVVLDEIEKTREEKTLWSLLMPWELGRCTFEANGRPVDVRNVVWIGTSNLGHELVFEHHEARARPNEMMSKEEYADLMALLRPRVSQRLGASIVSRVSAILPFVPFTREERRAICYEALHTIAGDVMHTLPLEAVDRMIEGALASYTADEGARSIYRAVSHQLVDNI